MTKPAAIRTSVAVLTADPAFEQSLRATFGASGQIDLRVVSGSISTVAEFAIEGATVVIVDLDTGRGEEMQALERMMQRTGGVPPVVVVAQSFEADVARSLLQMRVADFLVKPVQPLELVRTCARVARSSATETTEAQIYSVIPSSAARVSRPWRSRRHSCSSTAASASGRPPAWSISTSSTAPAPIISISNRGSTSRRSSRGRNGSTASFWRSCCRTMPRVSR
jgi:DNA-binding NarL/FixJ family response regulator